MIIIKDMESHMEKNHQNTDCSNGIINIDVASEGTLLNICVHEHMQGEVDSIQHYEGITVPMEQIEKRCRDMIEALNTTNRSGRISKEILVKLREVGQVLYDELFTQNAKEKLRNVKAQYLRLTIDDQLVQIPWELLYDGEQFLCQRFSMGRTVRTRQAIPKTSKRELVSPLKMLLIADPARDLMGAYKEGGEIRNYMDQFKTQVLVNSLFDNVTSAAVKEKIRNYDVVHFAGHADYNHKNPEKSGWRLTKDNLMANDIVKMAGARPMPSLVFSNACQSARTEKWSLKENYHSEIFGLANAFLLSGVKHYVGTFCEIPDEAGCQFALQFYDNLRRGKSTGEAVRLARKGLIQKFGEETITWASYILYGDPTISYSQTEEIESKYTEPTYIPVSNKVRTIDKNNENEDEEEVILFDPKEYHKKRIGSLVLLSGILLISAVLFAGGLYWFGKNSNPQSIQMITKDDKAHDLIVEEMRDKMYLVRDQEKKKEIAKNINELSKKIPGGKIIAETNDSDSLTMMVDFRSRDFYNGKEKLIASLITEQILKFSNIQLVEREDLDKVLQELNFGTSKLIDPSRRLTLGKILSANLILSGWVQDFDDTKTQISMRVSEIETGKTIIANNVVLSSEMPVIAQKGILTEKLVDQLNKLSKEVK